MKVNVVTDATWDFNKMHDCVHIVGEDANDYRLTCCDTDVEMATLEGRCVTTNAKAEELAAFLQTSVEIAQELIEVLCRRTAC